MLFQVRIAPSLMGKIWRRVFVEDVLVWSFAGCLVTVLNDKFETFGHEFSPITLNVIAILCNIVFHLSLLPRERLIRPARLVLLTLAVSQSISNWTQPTLVSELNGLAYMNFVKS